MDKKGLISSGASVWPKKMLAAAFIDSAAVVPTLMYSNHPGAIMLGLRHYYHPQILTNFANYKLKSPPIVEHADEETDKVNDGKRTEEEWYANNTIVEICEDVLDSRCQGGIVRLVVCLRNKGSASCEISKHKICPKIGVI